LISVLQVITPAFQSTMLIRPSLPLLLLLYLIQLAVCEFLSSEEYGDVGSTEKDAEATTKCFVANGRGN
jgi:hypothetical protein